MAGLRNVSLVSGALPYDIGTEKDIIAKKREIAKAMMANSMRQTNPVIDAGLFKVANWGDSVGKVADAYFGKKASDELDQQDRTVAAEANQRLGKGLEDYLNTRLGQQNVPVGQDTRALDESGAEGAPPTAMGNIAPNPIKAIAMAMSSNLGPLQQLAAGDIAAMIKGRTPGMLSPQDASHLKGIATNQSIVDALLSGDTTKLNYLRTIEKGADGNFGDITPAQSGQGAVKPAGYVGSTYNPPQPAQNGLPPLQTNQQSGEAKGLQGGNVTAAANREEKIAGADVKNVESGYANAQGAVKGLQAVATAQDLVGQIPDAAMGSLSDLRLFVNKGIQALGGKPLPEGAKVEQLKSVLGNLMIEKIRALAPVTQEDVKIMQNILGSNTNTKAALKQMLDYAAEQYGRTINQHNKFVENFSKEPGAGPDFANRWTVNFDVKGVPLGGAQQDDPLQILGR